MVDIPVIKVDSDIPLPPERAQVLSTFPLHEMGVGDSILFDRANQKRIAVAATQLKKRTGKSFTVRAQDEDTARIWRVS